MSVFPKSTTNKIASFSLQVFSFKLKENREDGNANMKKFCFDLVEIYPAICCIQKRRSSLIVIEAVEILDE